MCCDQKYKIAGQQCNKTAHSDARRVQLQVHAHKQHDQQNHPGTLGHERVNQIIGPSRRQWGKIVLQMKNVFQFFRAIDNRPIQPHFFGFAAGKLQGPPAPEISLAFGPGIGSGRCAASSSHMYAIKPVAFCVYGYTLSSGSIIAAGTDQLRARSLRSAFAQ